VANLETFRQVAEQGGAFLGQHAGQPMAHEHQDEFAILKLAPPKRLFPLAPPNGEINGNAISQGGVREISTPKKKRRRTSRRRSSGYPT
jgi:hypothetical protein